MNFIIPAVLDDTKPELFEILKASVRSIIQHEDHPKIFVFVNNSAFSEDKLKELDPFVKVHVYREPVSGFAEACNLAIAFSGFPNFVLMNSDIIIVEPVSEKIIQATLDNPGYGAIFPHWLPYAESCVNYEYGFEVGSGAFFYTTRKNMEDVGYFDESYKVGFFEDRDLWLKFLSSGFSLVRIRKLVVRHLGNSTIKYFLEKDQILENLEIFKSKWEKRFPLIVERFLSEYKNLR